jgi:nucleotide-binding universal stress UspA family protein
MVNEVSIRKILVAVDGSAPSENAVGYAARLAEVVKAEVLLMHVIEDIKMGGAIGLQAKYGNISLVEGYNRARKESALQWMALLEAKARDKKVKAKSEILYDTSNSVTGTVVDYAKRNNVDLIVVGTRGHSKFKQLLVGSVASGVSQHAHCPVLVVR